MHKLALILSCSSGAFTLGIGGAQAQDTAESGLEEIIVTAQRRAENLQETPVAISVVSGDALRAANVSRAEDLSLLVPGVDIVDTGTQSLVRIRGVGTNIQTALQDSQNAFSIDGVFNTANTAGDAGLFDLERMEIVKGPQGTLYGRNATGGAFNIITNKPKDYFEASAGVEYGNYSKLQTNGMLNVPLSDTLSMRTAFQTVKHDGYLSSGYNDADDRAGRLQFLYKPNERLSALLSGNVYKKGGMSTNYVPLNPVTFDYQNPSDPWQDSPAGSILSVADEARCVDSTTSAVVGNAFPYCSDRSGFTDNLIWSVNAQVDYDFGGATLTVIPAYISNRSDVQIFPRWLSLAIDSKNVQKTFEARLASNEGDSPLKWLVGVYALDGTNDAVQVIYQPTRRPTPTPFNLYPNTDYLNLTDESYAAFTQETFSFTDALRLTAGVRYTEEKKTKSGAYHTVLGSTDDTVTVTQPAATQVACAAFAASGAYFNGVNCVIPEVGYLKDSSLQYRVGIEADVAEQSMLYANVSTGFHAGGFYQGLPPDTYKPEKLTAYALGTKNRFLDNRLQVNAEAYFWDYKDLQYTSTGTITPAINGAVTVNAGRAEVYGLELQVDYLPTEQDRLSLALEFAEGENKEFTFAAARAPVAGSACVFTATPTGSVNCDGTKMISLPKVSGNLSYEHSFAFGNGAALVAAASVHYESSSWLSYDMLPWQEADGYHMSGANLTYVAAGERSWSIGAYVNNIENEAVQTTGSFGSLTYMNTPYVTLAAPRTYGARVEVKF